jgi:lipopolysaccharide export system protein LptA
MGKKFFSDRNPRRWGGWSLLLVLVCGLMTIVSSEDEAPLILQNADYNENTLSNGKLVSVLKGNVHFVYKDAEIISQNAIWHRSDGVAKFSDSVRINRTNQVMTCKKLDFFRDRKLVILTGNVDFYDSKENVRMLAQKGVYHLDTRAVEMEKEPHLFRYDTTAHDTMEIVGRRMYYDDSLKLATVYDDVKINKGKMIADCQTAFYYPESDIAKLRVKPHILYDIHTLDGDSVNLDFKDELLRGISVRGKAKAIHKDFATSDSLVTEIKGDSLYMRITDAGHIDTTWVYRNVESKYFSKKTPDETNEAHGKVMVLNFNKAGNADNLVIQGNAQSIYYVADASGTGRNEASGDKIKLYFRQGKAAFLTITGAVRGIYFAQKQRVTKK